jgi:hypothetical protein
MPTRSMYVPLATNLRLNPVCSTPAAPRPSTTLALERKLTPSNCYNCSKPSYFTNKCPTLQVREIGAEIAKEEDF